MQKIYEIAESEKIYIAYDDLQRIGDIQGFYTVHPRAGPIIVLDIGLLSQPKLHRCVAAHELGHHFYPPRNPSNVVFFHCYNYFQDSQKEIIVSQDENKALRWATELLMPSSKVWDAIKYGYDTIPFLADYFNVTEWFARAKIGFLRREARDAGVKLKWRDIINKTAYYKRRVPHNGRN